MRKKTVHTTPKSSIKTLKIFLLVVCFFVAVSLLIKVFLAVRKSTYDSSHAYTIGVLRPDNTLSEVISCNPVAKSSVVLEIQGREQGMSPEQLMGVSFDGTITAASATTSIQSLLFNALLHRSQVKTTISTVDLFRLLLFTNSLSQTSQLTRTLGVPLDSPQIDKVSSSLFADPAFSVDDASIQIINGTAEAGFGNRLERMLSNMGANVVVVSTSQSQVNQTKLLYYGHESESAKRLGQILHLTPQKGGRKTIADIVIMLGQSSSSTTKF